MRRSPAGTRSFWRSMEATREPGDDLLSFNVSRKPRSRKGSRLTTTRRTGQAALPTRHERAESRAIFVSQKTAWFLPQGQRGGWDTIRARDGTLLYSPIYLIPVDLSPGNRPSGAERQKFGRDDSDPPQKRGGHAVPCSCPVGQALTPAPGGRYRRYLSLREGSEKTPRSGVD